MSADFNAKKRLNCSLLAISVSFARSNSPRIMIVFFIRNVKPFRYRNVNLSNRFVVTDFFTTVRIISYLFSELFSFDKIAKRTSDILVSMETLADIFFREFFSGFAFQRRPPLKIDHIYCRFFPRTFFEEHGHAKLDDGRSDVRGV